MQATQHITRLARSRLVSAATASASSSSRTSTVRSSTRHHVQYRTQSSSAAATATKRSSTTVSPATGKSAAPEPLVPSTTSTASKPGHDHSFMGMSGGQIFHEMMLRQGVKHVFGYPGGAILPVFDAIYNSKHFEFILPRAEQGAGHAAEAYARVT